LNLRIHNFLIVQVTVDVGLALGSDTAEFDSDTVFSLVVVFERVSIARKTVDAVLFASTGHIAAFET
jgi:hypothetical protein